jgi:hypothetical protein
MREASPFAAAWPSSKNFIQSFFDQKKRNQISSQQNIIKISAPPQKKLFHPMFTADLVSPLGVGLGFRV